MSALFIAVSIDLLFFFVVTMWLAQSKLLNRPSKVLCDLEDKVDVRQNSLARLFTGFSTSIIKTQVRKIQVTDQCVTLFTCTNSAIDIWVAPNQLTANAARARSLFPTADYLEIT